MDLAILARLNQARAERRAAVLVRDIATGEARLHLAEEIVREPLAGTALGEALAEALRRGASGTVEIEGRSLFLNVHVPPVRIIAIGAVHISQALVPFAAALGFDLTIIDPRTAFATPERFPGVKLLAEWPDIALPPLALDRYTALLALTHDPKIDDPALIHALPRDLFYVGALGSRKTHAKRLERLAAAGLTDAQLDGIHAPIGLPIGAISPAEIALAVMAELVAALRKAERA